MRQMCCIYSFQHPCSLHSVDRATRLLASASLHIEPRHSATACGAALTMSLRIVPFVLIVTAIMGSPVAAKQAIKPIPQVVQAAASEMLTMFQSRDVKQQSGIIKERYAPTATFTDPLMKVKGHKDIALEFYSLIKIFSNVEVKQKDMKVTEGDKAGVYKAALDNTQTYTTEPTSFFSKHFMPRKVDIEATTTLEVDSEGKILSHTEVWHNKSVPIPGFLKPAVGISTAAWFKLLGWGKDVDVKMVAAVAEQ